MACKLWVGLAVALFACCAQANLDKFGDLGTGEEGFYKHCFTRLSLSNLIGANYKQIAGSLLSSDRKEVEAKLDADFAAFGGSSACSRYCFDKIVARERASFQAGEKELDTDRCERSARFKRLCELVRQQKSGNVRVLSIERWLCLTSKTVEINLHFGYFKCQEVEGYPKAFESLADKELNSVLSYSFEELKEKEKESAREIEASSKLRREFDRKIVKEAYSRVNKRIDELPKFSECSKKEVADKAEAKAIRELVKLRQERYKYEAKMRKENNDLTALGMFALASLDG